MARRRFLSIALIALAVGLGVSGAQAQQRNETVTAGKELQSYIQEYRHPLLTRKLEAKILSIEWNKQEKTVTLNLSDRFAYQPFRVDLVENIYKEVKQLLPANLRTQELQIKVGRYRLEELVTPIYGGTAIKDGVISRPKAHHTDNWVMPLSRPYEIEKGLPGSNLFIWPGHGRYYRRHARLGNEWKWQRLNLFCTVEDLLTRSFVFPYLVPMLERAGAFVFTPVERDPQPNEVIMSGGENLTMPTTQRGHEAQSTFFTPSIPAAGKYATYVRYKTHQNSVADARYIVHHAGGKTEFAVNQQIGANTWVYLGTFQYNDGTSRSNSVELSTQSRARGVVSVGEVRFGGGMGSIVREGMTSGFPRYYEGARYMAEYSGTDATVFQNRQGENDYTEDINTRSLWLNQLLNESRVPFDLSLAVHTDAGIDLSGGTIGTLGVYTTANVSAAADQPTLANGQDRLVSRYLADALVTGLHTDISTRYKTSWTRRHIWDRNYSETRLPEVPSAIIELLSHQNFTDMRYAHDPVFKFTVARSLYKSILRFISMQRGESYVVQPLPPKDFSISFTNNSRRVRLDWKPTNDPAEPTAAARRYIIYTRIGEGDFDNGTLVSHTSHDITVEPDKIYSFRIAAVNDGGESFPSETLTCRLSSGEHRRALIVNGFTRLAPPAVVDDGEFAYFDVAADPGVPYMEERSIIGQQVVRRIENVGREDETGWGHSSDEWTGKVIYGNTFDYPFTHGLAMSRMPGLSFVSCSRGAFESGLIETADFDLVNLIMGLQKLDKEVLFLRNDDYSIFTPALLRHLKTFLGTRKDARLPALIISGAYLSSEYEKVVDLLHLKGEGIIPSMPVTGMQRSFNLGEEASYPVNFTSSLYPKTDNAMNFPFFSYMDGTSAGVAWDGTDYRVLTLGFPFESIPTKEQRSDLMSGLLNFLFR